MRKGLKLLCTIALVGGFSLAATAQQSNTTLGLQTHMGYSSNTYLNPFYSEWNPAVQSSYSMLMPTVQWNMYKNNTSLDLTGGLVYQPLWNEDITSTGGFALSNAQYRLTSALSGGIEAGFSRFSSTYIRQSIWLQPVLTWFITPFSQLKFKAGPSFQGYQNLEERPDTTGRFDAAAIEFESWPNFRWRLRAGIYSSLDNLSSPQDAFSSRMNISHIFPGSVTLSMKLGYEQYEYQRTVTEPGGGFPPTSPTTSTVTDADRIVRLGSVLSVPLHNQISMLLNAEVLNLYSDTAAETQRDYQISGGVRMHLSPSALKKSGDITPEWNNSEGEGEATVTVRYADDGLLYVTGDFNNWERPGIPLVKQSGNRFTAEIEVEPGAYEYKILRVKGNEEEWLELSSDSYTVDDGFGGENGMLLIEQ